MDSGKGTTIKALLKENSRKLGGLILTTMTLFSLLYQDKLFDFNDDPLKTIKTNESKVWVQTDSEDNNNLLKMKLNYAIHGLYHTLLSFFLYIYFAILTLSWNAESLRFFQIHKV